MHNNITMTRFSYLLMASYSSHVSRLVLDSFQRQQFRHKYSQAPVRSRPVAQNKKEKEPQHTTSARDHQSIVNNTRTYRHKIKGIASRSPRGPRNDGHKKKMPQLRCLVGFSGGHAAAVALRVLDCIIKPSSSTSEKEILLSSAFYIPLCCCCVSLNIY